ncbi:glycine betaine/L-proline ABC transporter substrate-binding protein ProX [Bradyrhizobium diazoefficiens]|uniref:glycine betaine/L-proline ABC transporter substrate-binding protein ProX n=1 Tax=Bradyrhizobium diazoefficiens TaxID=1355477 RepID=UPI0034802AB9
MRYFQISRRQVLAAGIATLSAPALLRAQNSNVIKPVCASWDTFWFAELIAKAGLERLGYQVEDRRVMTPAVIFQSLALGDTHFTMDVVWPGAKWTYEPVKDKVGLLGPTVQPASFIGYLIDKATAEKHNIRRLSDFKNPKIASLFSEGIDRRARLIGAPSGSNDETRVISDVEKFGLKDTVNLVIGEYNVLTADVVARYRAGKPVFLFGWYPNVATTELVPGTDLVWIEYDGAQSELASKGIVGCASGGDSCNTGWSPTTYYVAASTNWCRENPKAAKFLSSMRMTLDDRVKQNALMAKGEKRDRDLARHAADWIKANQAAFDGWIDAAKA